MIVKALKGGKRGTRVDLCKSDLSFEWSSFSTRNNVGLSFVCGYSSVAKVEEENPP